MIPAALPPVIVGAAAMGSPLPEALVPAFERTRAFAVLDGLLDLGCTAFDLAASYQLGGTERLFGRYMASRRNRDRVFLISKGGHPVPIVAPHRITPAALTADLHASLRRLRTDRVDLYLLHRDDEAAPLEAVLDVLTTLGRQGKLAAWGVSNWTHARVKALAALAEVTGVPSVAASSPHFSLLEWAEPPWRGCVSIAGEANREARAYYATAGVPVLAWSPLGSGFFSSSPRAVARSRRHPSYASAANALRRQRAEVLARKYGRTPAQIALAYLYSQPFSVSAVVAASTPAHMKENLEATTLALPRAEVSWLETGEGSIDA